MHSPVPPSKRTPEFLFLSLKSAVAIAPLRCTFAPPVRHSVFSILNVALYRRDRGYRRRQHAGRVFVVRLARDFLWLSNISPVLCDAWHSAAAGSAAAVLCAASATASGRAVHAATRMPASVVAACRLQTLVPRRHNCVNAGRAGVCADAGAERAPGEFLRTVLHASAAGCATVPFVRREPIGGLRVVLRFSARHAAGLAVDVQRIHL